MDGAQLFLADDVPSGLELHAECREEGFDLGQYGFEIPGGLDIECNVERIGCDSGQLGHWLLDGGDERGKSGDKPGAQPSMPCWHRRAT